MAVTVRNLQPPPIASYITSRLRRSNKDRIDKTVSKDYQEQEAAKKLRRLKKERTEPVLKNR
jgi:hypothetical protein